MSRDKQRGSVILEFTLSGIPLIFLWIALIQMSVGMWRYHTLQYAVKQAGAYITVHGSECLLPGNSCGIRIQNAAQVLQESATGIPPSLISVTFQVYGPDHTTAYATPVTCTLDNCLADNTLWPPVGWNDPGYDVEIAASYRFGSVVGVFAPGRGAAAPIGGYNLPAYTRQRILF